MNWTAAALGTLGGVVVGWLLAPAVYKRSRAFFDKRLRTMSEQQLKRFVARFRRAERVIWWGGMVGLLLLAGLCAWYEARLGFAAAAVSGTICCLRPNNPYS